MAFDLKDSKNQKIVLAVMVVVLGAYFWYAKVYSPNVARIEAKVAEHERILTDLRNVELKAKSFDALKDEYESLYAQYLQISSLLPDQRQLEDFLLQLHQAAITTETEITAVTPKPPMASGFYMTNGFQMEVSGSYHALGRFFASVANFPFIANVRNVQITALPMSTQVDPKSGKGQTLTATFSIETYFASEAAAIQPLNF
jgi:Tfp pilus assembly protein PilO